MAMELIGAAGMTAELKQTYDRMLLTRALPALVHANWGVKKNVPARGGKSIEFRKMEAISASTTALTEGTPPAVTNATFSTVAVTISQYGQYAQITDLLDTQAFDPVVAEYVENFGEAMGDSLDQVVRDIIVAGTTIQYASTAATRTGASGVGSGMYINSAEIREAISTLKRNNAKPVADGKYVCVLHPDNSRDLFSDANIVNAFSYAAPRSDANPLFTGVLGDYMGVRFVETTNLKIQASWGLSGADVYMVLFIGKEAYCVTELDALQARTIIHPRGSGGHTDPLEQYSTVGWKAALAAKILNNNFMVRLECNASRTTAA